MLQHDVKSGDGSAPSWNGSAPSWNGSAPSWNGSDPSLLTHLQQIPDPREQGYALRHPLINVLAIALCAMICGAETFVDMHEFALAKRDWFTNRLGLDLSAGVPSHDTIGRVFAQMDPHAFQRCFLGWTRALQDVTHGEIIAIDGKTLRHSFDTALGKKAIHMVSAWASQARLVLAQVKTDEKSNEITAVPALLALLDLKGCIVTVDAMNTQKANAAQIVQQGGDWLFPLKDNHPTLHDEVRRLFAWARSKDAYNPYQDRLDIHVDFHESHDYDHGRQEIRRCWCTDGIGWLDETDEPSSWAGLRSVALIERERTVNGSTSIEQTHYLSSIAPSARKVAAIAREHWGIENRLHWVLDVAYDEDDSRVRKDHAPQNLSMLRQLSLNLIRQEKTRKHGVAAGRKKAGWDENYLLKILLS
jgi:predicted transposase YbfD/YdcC